MKNCHFVMVSPVYFDQLKQRHQAFARHLVENGHRVSYIEPLQAGGISLNGKIEYQGLKIYQITVPWRCTGQILLHEPMVRLAAAILRKKTAIDCKRSILWLSDPSMAAFAQAGWKKVIYDRCDLHGFFPGQRKTAWEHYESEIYDSADLIIASHKHLIDDLPINVATKSMLVGNACAEIFIKPPNMARPLIPPVKIISSGAHYEWIDMEWLSMFCNIADVELHIAGSGRGKEFKELINSPSVRFHGQLCHEKLAQLIHDCHVGLLPFKNIKLSHGVDPIKAYEYAAGGLTIWAPEWFNSRHIDEKISSRDAIERAISRLKQFNDREKKQKKYATWAERTKTVLDRLNDFCSD